MLGGLFRGAAKEQVVYILEEGARAERASGQVPGQSLPEVVGTVSEPLREYGPCELCGQLGVGSVQVKAKRNWQSGWSGMVKKASLRSITVK